MSLEPIFFKTRMGALGEWRTLPYLISLAISLLYYFNLVFRVVEYRLKADCARALRTLNGSVLEGRTLKIKMVSHRILLILLG